MSVRECESISKPHFRKGVRLFLYKNCPTTSRALIPHTSMLCIGVIDLDDVSIREVPEDLLVGRAFVV